MLGKKMEHIDILYVSMTELGEQQENCKQFSDIWSAIYVIRTHPLQNMKHIDILYVSMIIWKVAKFHTKSKACRYINEGGCSKRLEQPCLAYSIQFVILDLDRSR